MTALRQTRGAVRKDQTRAIEALREWVETYGEVPTTAAFNPSVARWRDDEVSVGRYYTPRKDGSKWPALNSIKKAFDGSFSAALVAAGFQPHKPGGTRRRPAGRHAPVRDVRIERVYVPSEQTAWLRQQLEKAERRALRAEQRLEEAKARVVVVRDEAEVEKLRERLADEKARRKQVQRALTNAERREARARDAVEAARVRGGTLREVERLTERLAEAESRIRGLKARPPTEVGDRQPPARTLPEVSVPDEKALRRAERAEVRLEELRAELRHLAEEKDELTERLAEIRREAVADALATEKVREALRRAEAAEKRAEELAVLAVGERRRLTREEVDDLRRNGPAGRPVLAKAIKRLAQSEGSFSQRAALREVAEAAVSWMEKL